MFLCKVNKRKRGKDGTKENIDDMKLESNKSEGWNMKTCVD